MEQSEQMEKVEKVRQLFLELLKCENSGYKYKNQYYDYIVSTNDDIHDQLINMRLFIKREWGTCRGHNPNEGHFEVEIMKISRKILLEQMSDYMVLLNNFLQNEKSITYELNVNPDCSLLIYEVNYNFVDEFNDKSKHDIVHNLKSFVELKHINRLQQNNFIVRTLLNYFTCLL